MLRICQRNLRIFFLKALSLEYSIELDLVKTEQFQQSKWRERKKNRFKQLATMMMMLLLPMIRFRQSAQWISNAICIGIDITFFHRGMRHTKREKNHATLIMDERNVKYFFSHIFSRPPPLSLSFSSIRCWNNQQNKLNLPLA